MRLYTLYCTEAGMRLVLMASLQVFFSTQNMRMEENAPTGKEVKDGNMSLCFSLLPVEKVCVNCLL